MTDAETISRSLSTGQAAPDFTLPSTEGEVSLSALKGKKVILYFYPKDDTPGCTLEGKDFSALKDKFEAAGAVVYGISKDSVDSHHKFCGKFSFTIPLISDESGSMAEDYGVWVEKNMYGKKYMGIERTTFLIHQTGKIANIWNKVKVEHHAEDVLKAAEGV